MANFRGSIFIPSEEALARALTDFKFSPHSDYKVECLQKVLLYHLAPDAIGELWDPCRSTEVFERRMLRLRNPSYIAHGSACPLKFGPLFWCKGESTGRGMCLR